MSSSPTEPEAQSPSKPAPRLKVDVAGKDRDLFMSFGLLNELATLVGGAEQVPQLSFDMQMSTSALTLVLAKRTKRGEIIQPENDDEPIIPVDLSPESAEQIIDWVAAHVLDFFVRRFASSVKLFGTQANNMAAAGSSLTSSQSSLGKTP